MVSESSGTGDAFWGLLGWDRAYGEEENRRNGLVSLNACAAAMQPARAVIERRIVCELACLSSLSDDAAQSSISATYILHP
jgi:hypothetical protein